MNETDKFIRQAEIGEEARAFLEGNLGTALLAKALHLRAEALEKMESVNPTDVPKIEELQRRARLPKYFEQWLYELVQEGDNAFTILGEQNKHE
jgi:primosomal protein N''